MVFNNGSAQVQAAERFLQWLTEPAQVSYFSLRTGDLPIRASVANGPGFLRRMDGILPQVSTFVENLGNVRQARPQLPAYPQVSQILGSAIVSVLLGKSQPGPALKAAAQQVDQVLANPNG